jgi:hypothetical protein
VSHHHAYELISCDVVSLVDVFLLFHIVRLRSREEKEINRIAVKRKDIWQINNFDDSPQKMKKSDACGLASRDRRSKSRLNCTLFLAWIIDSFSTWENLSKITTVGPLMRGKRFFRYVGEGPIET